MARDTVRSSGTEELRFSNGTILQGLGIPIQATQFIPGGDGLRGMLPAENDSGPEFLQALSALEFREQETIHFDFPVPSALRGTDKGQSQLRFKPATPAADDDPRVVLYQDESGGLSWHFTPGVTLTAEERERAARRGFRYDPTEFVIPLRNAAVQNTLQLGLPQRSLRGPITKVGRKIFKVLVLPAAARLLEKPVEQIVGAAERRHRKNLVWQLTPANYKQGSNVEFTDWQSFRGKRCLLVVHGTFSTVEGMLNRLPRQAMQRWCDFYEGRVLAFNHLSVSASPEENARLFLERARDALGSGSIDFDVLCHSRGGIVSRILAEHGQALVPGNKCAFKNVFFVATPNRGSVLCDPGHMVDMLDVFTNVLSSFPDGPVLYSIEIFLALVKLLATAGGRALPGIAAMATRSEDYLAKILNAGHQPSPARYAAAAADYEPRPGLDNGYLLARFGNLAMDRVFEQDQQPVPNDLVVPRDGVYSANGHVSFPIANPLVFQGSEGVWHSGFFSQENVIERIEEHFGMRVQVQAAEPDGSIRAPEPSDLMPDGAASPKEAEPTSFEFITPGRLERGDLRGPESAPAATTPLPETTLQRQPEILFHELMTEGGTSDLVVRLNEALSAAQIQDLLAFHLAAGEDELQVVVELSAPGFQIVGSRNATLTLKRQRDPESEKVVFKLTAQSPGAMPVKREIIAGFWQENNCVGVVKHWTVVRPREWQGPIQTEDAPRDLALSFPARKRQYPEMVIFVRKVSGDEEFYELSLRSEIEGQEYASKPVGRFELAGKELSKYFSDAIDPAFRTFPNPRLPDDQFEPALAAWNKALITRISDLGVELWQKVLPEPFRQEYLRLMGLPHPPESICVHSDEMIFPWEIVRPRGEINGQYRQDLPVLGALHVLGRWRTDLGARPQPQAQPISKMVVLSPRYATGGLAWSAQEAAELARLIGGIEPPVNPLTRAAMDQLLAREDVQVVHFTGHGDWDAGTNADLSTLRLENGESIPAMAFAANRLGARAHPILYLNACTVGRVAQALGHPGGFAGNCVGAGWSGVVAPYWPVYDPKAYEFSLKFYSKIQAGRSVGEALQELRRDNPDDPTALSYSYFGDPWARLLFM